MSYAKFNKADAWAILSLVLLCVLAYHGLVGHYFWEDDFVQIGLGKKAFDAFGNIFAPSPNFRPLDRLAFFLNYKVSGVNPAGYNVFNIALHLCNALLLYVLLNTVFGDRLLSFSAAALFVTANTNCDAVFWVAARSGLISLSLLLLSLIFWARYRVTERPAPRHYYLSLLFMSLAFFAKEEAAVYPFLLILTDRFFLDEGKDPKDTRLRYAGFFAALAAYLCLQAYLQIFAKAAYAHYTQSMSVPGLNSLANLVELFLYFFTPSFVVFNSHHLVLALSVVVIGCLVAAGYATGHRKEVVWAVLWILVSFLPMSLFSWDLMATVERAFIRRYFYTPSVGAVFILGFFVNWLYNAMKRTRLAAGVTGLVIVAMLGWNLKEVNRSERGWGERTGYVRSEVVAIKGLYPKIPPGKAGFILGGFAQRDLFNENMLRLIYDKDDIVLYKKDDPEKMLGDKGLALRAVLLKQDGYITDYASGRSVPLPVQ